MGVRERNDDVIRIFQSTKDREIKKVTKENFGTAGEYYLQDDIHNQDDILTTDEVVSLELSKLPASFYYVSDNPNIPSGVYRMRVITTVNTVNNRDKTKVVTKTISRVEYYNRLLNHEYVLYSCTLLQEDIKFLINIIKKDLYDILCNQEQILTYYKEVIDSLLTK